MNIKEIGELAKIVSQNNMESIEVITKDITIKIKMPTSGTVVETYINRTPSVVTKEEPLPKIEAQSNSKEIKSPMVGVFYASPSPDSPPFVKIGDKVKKGDVLCIIEAMKLMNEIEAEYDCEIVDICANNGQVIEFSQILFRAV